jgi:hypothetical protein
MKSRALERERERKRGEGRRETMERKGKEK